MGKIRTRTIGDEEIEKQQKEEAKKKADEKKSLKQNQEKVKETKEEPEKKEPEKKAKKVNKESQDGAKKKPATSSRGKKYKEAKKLIDKTKSYHLTDAVDIIKKIKIASFDESVELHMNVDEIGLKGETDLPHSTGKTVKVAVVSDEILADLEKGKIEFDVLVTHPSFMPKLAKFARVLGPKGLMPNPKAGTVSPKPEEVVKKFAKGTLRWKTEAKFPLVHQMIGKTSLEAKALIENTQKFVNAVGKQHIKKLYIKSTMSPAIKLDVENV